jgi:hypothetical protein
MQSVRYCCPVLTKTVMCRQILVKLLHITLYDKSFRRRVVTCAQTDGWTEHCERVQEHYMYNRSTYVCMRTPLQAMLRVAAFTLRYLQPITVSMKSLGLLLATLTYAQMRFLTGEWEVFSNVVFVLTFGVCLWTCRMTGHLHSSLN